MFLLFSFGVKGPSVIFSFLQPSFHYFLFSNFLSLSPSAGVTFFLAEKESNQRKASQN